jgi:hypothetical protein
MKRPLWSLDSLLKLIVIITLFVVVLVGVNSFEQSYTMNALDYSQQALKKTVLQCYAFEGNYPPDLAYLVNNYGLVLDEERFVYHYRFIGNNILPEMAVFLLKE